MSEVSGAVLPGDVRVSYTWVCQWLNRSSVGRVCSSVRMNLLTMEGLRTIYSTATIAGGFASRRSYFYFTKAPHQESASERSMQEGFLEQLASRIGARAGLIR